MVGFVLVQLLLEQNDLQYSSSYLLFVQLSHSFDVGSASWILHYMARLRSYLQL